MDTSKVSPILQKAHQLSQAELEELIEQLQALQKQKAKPPVQANSPLDEVEKLPLGSGKRLAKLSEIWNFESGYSDTAEKSREILKEYFATHITRKMTGNE